MPRRIVSLCVILFSCVLGFVAVAGPADAGRGGGPGGGGHPRTSLGPGDAGVHDMGGKAVIRQSKHGYVYISGQQSTHLKVTHIKKLHSLRYREMGTRTLTSIPKSCHREKVKKGVSAVCLIQKRFENRHMFVQYWPRLGNDVLDGRSLSPKFRLWMLADGGRDRMLGGAGDDFANGAKDGDHLMGGPGNDWLRGGPAADHLVGGPGRDRLSPG